MVARRQRAQDSTTISRWAALRCTPRTCWEAHVICGRLNLALVGDELVAGRRQGGCLCAAPVSCRPQLCRSGVRTTSIRLEAGLPQRLALQALLEVPVGAPQLEPCSCWLSCRWCALPCTTGHARQA